MSNVDELFRLFGEAFKEERNFMHITQKQMAQMLGCSESEYKAIEAGKPTVNAALFLKICGSFGTVSIRNLFENVGISFDINHTVGKHGKKLTYFMDFFNEDCVVLQVPKKKYGQQCEVFNLFEDTWENE